MTHDDDEPKVSWHLDKRINVGHFLTTLALAFALFSWANAIDRRVVVLEERNVINDRDHKRNEIAIDRLGLLVHEELKQMNTKLDRVVEQNNRFMGRVSEDRGSRSNNGGHTR